MKTNKLRYVLLGTWLSQLAWISAPLVEAASDVGADYRRSEFTQATALDLCRGDWSGGYCAMLQSPSDDEKPSVRRIKTHDVVSALLQTFTADELDLLHLKNTSTFRPFTRHFGVSDLNVDFSVAAQGTKLRLRRSDEDLALSLRGAGAETRDGDVVTGVNVNLHW